MEDLSTYLKRICEDKYVGSSDTAVYARMGMHKWKHVSPETRKQLQDKYPGIPNDRHQLARWYKSVSGKLVPDEMEFIHRADWNVVEQIGEIESALMSPHKWTYFDCIRKNPRPKKNKILTVVECSNSKPYCCNAALRLYFSRFRSFTDFAVGAYGIIPEEYSQLYPIREDEWAHADNLESDLIRFKYRLVSCNRGYEYIKDMGYEKVIVFYQNPVLGEFMNWMKNMPDMKDKLIYVVTPQLMDKLKKEYPQLGDGLLITRLLGLPTTQEAYMNALGKCLDGEDKKRFNEIKNLVLGGDKSGIDNWVEETNKKFRIEKYRADVPGWEIKLDRDKNKLHGPTSDLSDAMIDEFKAYIKKWVEEMNKKEVNEKTICKDQFVFTPLDLIIKKYNLGPDNPECLKIDEMYWNMMKAIEDLADELGFERVYQDKHHRYDYVWCFGKVIKTIEKQDLMDMCDDYGLSQFYQNALKR